MLFLISVMAAFMTISSPSWLRSYNKARISCSTDRMMVTRRRQVIHHSQTHKPAARSSKAHSER